MPRPADELAAQLAAEDEDFVAAAMSGDLQVARLGRHGRGFRYRKGDQVREVFGAEITHLPDGTEVDTDLVDDGAEDVTVTPFDARFTQGGGYGIRYGALTLRFGDPEYRVSPGVWAAVPLTGKQRAGNRVRWVTPWGEYGMRLTTGGVETRWRFDSQPDPIRVRLTVTGGTISADGLIVLGDGELRVGGIVWRDAAGTEGAAPFVMQGGFLPLQLPAGLVFPVTVDG